MINKDTPKTLRDRIHKQSAKDWGTLIKKRHDVSEIGDEDE